MQQTHAALCGDLLRHTCWRHDQPCLFRNAPVGEDQVHVPCTQHASAMHHGTSSWRLPTSCFRGVCRGMCVQTRVRTRQNGRIAALGDRLEVDLDVSFGSCPKFIQSRPHVRSPTCAPLASSFTSIDDKPLPRSGVIGAFAAPLTPCSPCLRPDVRLHWVLRCALASPASSSAPQGFWVMCACAD